MNKDIETEIITRRQETLKGLELQILEGGFMPTLNGDIDRLALYSNYYKNKYEATPIQAKETRILYQTIGYLIQSELERRGDNKWTTK